MSGLTNLVGRNRLTFLALLGCLFLLSTTSVAMAADGQGQSIPFRWEWLIVPIGALAGLVMAAKFYKDVKKANPGDESMQEIAQHVTDGALAYLKRQYKVVAVFFIVVAVLLMLMGWVFHLQHKIVFFGFLVAGLLSGLCGFLGMKTATMASNRTAQGAKEGLNRGLTVAFRAGAVMGLLVVGFALLDISFWYVILTIVAPAFGYQMGLVEVSVVMLTFAMGASSQALFARVGGGIYTKAADVGADLVGKVEAGIPEDDPRNPATIADNVGDNVGDVAGMGADLYESYYGSILATAALGVSAAFALGAGAMAIRLMIAPMVIAGVGILLSILGVFSVRCREGASMKQLMGSLHRGVLLASGLILVFAFGICYLLLSGIDGVPWMGVWGAIVSGMVAGIVIGKATEYYTSYEFKPTRGVAESAATGPGTVIISGLAEGMKSTWASLATIIVAILLAYSLAGGFGNTLLGLYGVGIAAVGMLSTLGITLATDAYGPIADNAGGNAEMTGQPPEVRERTDALDSLGNTTAAVGKGFAIGSAALTALALLAAYVEQVRSGLNREAGVAVVQAIPEAGEKPEAGLGEMVYLGYRKFAAKTSEGTGEEAFSAFLALGDIPEEIQPGQRVEGFTLDVADEVNVRRLGRGDVIIPMVSARKASLEQFMGFFRITLINPQVLCGIFAGILLVFLFSAMTMQAVGRAAMAMVREVRRQFREIPGIMEGTGKPDYARCVEISTAGAQKEMIVPSMLALVVPIAVGLVLDVGGVLGLLAGGLACGFAMAVFMANAGGAWDNAKKYIETGAQGGKGSDAHKASVTGDTVGDPFKDTSGPSLNILIKLMSMVSVVFAGLIVKYAPYISELLESLGG
jgi:H(+)-translocating pyrophosphatase